MAHFKNDGGGGDERLYISTSPDGLTWQGINGPGPVWQPVGWSPFGNVVRDPSIVYADGWYWVAYTSGTYGAHASFGLVKSQDLVSWTFVGEISTMFPGVTDPLTWGPFFFKDSDGSVHIFVSVSPINGSQFAPKPALRTYELHPTNASWTQWSTPIQVDLPSTNTNEFWVWKEGDLYHAIFVDFLQRANYVHVTSTSLVTGWGNAQLMGFASQEGGFILPKADGGYRLYLELGNSTSKPTYQYCDTTDFIHFTPQISTVSQIPMRNGKPIAAPNGTSFSAWSAAQNFPIGNDGLLDDPDHDGELNLAEFALGSDPNAASTVEPATILPLAGGNEMIFNRNSGLSNVMLEPERADELGQWQSGPAVFRTVSETLMATGLVRVRIRDISGASGAKSFYRLKVSVP